LTPRIASDSKNAVARLKKKPNLALKLRDAAMPALAICIVAFFAGFALFGSNGALAWSEYSRAITAKQAELAKLERERAVLANRVKLLDPRHVNPDLADELVRRDMGVVHPDEVILPIR
jgi:cell division protein FtsB